MLAAQHREWVAAVRARDRHATLTPVAVVLGACRRHSRPPIPETTEPLVEGRTGKPPPRHPTAHTPAVHTGGDMPVDHLLCQGKLLTFSAIHTHTPAPFPGRPRIDVGLRPPSRHQHPMTPPV